MMMIDGKWKLPCWFLVKNKQALQRTLLLFVGTKAEKPQPIMWWNNSETVSIMVPIGVSVLNMIRWDVIVAVYRHEKIIPSFGQHDENNFFFVNISSCDKKIIFCLFGRKRIIDLLLLIGRTFSIRTIGFWIQLHIFPGKNTLKYNISCVCLERACPEPSTGTSNWYLYRWS